MSQKDEEDLANMFAKLNPKAKVLTKNIVGKTHIKLRDRANIPKPENFVTTTKLIKKKKKNRDTKDTKASSASRTTGSRTTASRTTGSRTTGSRTTGSRTTGSRALSPVPEDARASPHDAEVVQDTSSVSEIESLKRQMRSIMYRIKNLELFDRHQKRRPHKKVIGISGIPSMYARNLKDTPVNKLPRY